MRQGHTLLELTLVLVVTRLCLAISLPRITAVMDGLAVEQAAREVVSAHRRARVAAIVTGRSVLLVVSPESLAYRVAGESDARWRQPGPARDNIVMASPPRQVTFSPVGITTGLANASYRLIRGGQQPNRRVSRLGRVRVTRP